MQKEKTVTVFKMQYNTFNNVFCVYILLHLFIYFEFY
jgi:hypothetical protein